MDVHIPFGIPLPINSSNLYQATKESWLLGRVAIPEGSMSVLGQRVFLPQAERICDILDKEYGNIKLVLSEAPKFYQFHQNEKPLFKEDTRELREAMLLIPSLIPISLWDVCQFFNDSTNLWGKEDILDFIDMVRDNSDRAVFTQMSSKYDFVRFASL